VRKTTRGGGGGRPVGGAGAALRQVARQGLGWPLGCASALPQGPAVPVCGGGGASRRGRGPRAAGRSGLRSRGGGRMDRRSGVVGAFGMTRCGTPARSAAAVQVWNLNFLTSNPQFHVIT